MELPVVLPIIALFLLWIVLGLLLALLYPAMSSVIQTLRPDLRSIFQLVYALLPLLIAATTAVLVFTPLLGGVYLSSHCHDPGCASHVPVLYAGSVGGKLISWFLFVILFIAVTFFILAVWKNYRSVNTLCKLSRSDISNSFNVLETRDIFACSIGMLRPRVLVSRGILDRATPDQLRVIIGHELAHGYRFDNLRRFVVSAVTYSWPYRSRIRLLTDMEQASEQSCDRDVSLMVAGRKIVMETIREVNQWQGGLQTSALTCSRIKSLSSSGQIRVDGWKPAAAMLTGSIVFTLLIGDLLHLAAENLLSVVVY